MQDVQSFIPFLYIFTQNSKNPEIYDLDNGPTTTKLSYVRMTRPYATYMQRVGAKWVLESFQDCQKYFFTGLIPLTGNWFNGDAKNGDYRYLILTYIPNDMDSLAIIILPNKPKNLVRNYLLTEIQKGPYSHVPSLLKKLRSDNSLVKIAK